MKHYLALVVVSLMVLVSAVSAVPTTGAATDVTSNSFNVSVTGVTGSDVWIFYGEYSGKENWVSPNETATAGVASVMVIGAPLLGGKTVVYQACDNTGCGNEETVTISAITPVPTGTMDTFLRNITKARFSPASIQSSLMSTYTTVAPGVVMIGIAGLFFAIGIWYRTKSVRLALMLGILIIPFVRYNTNGLYLGLPSTGIDFLQGLIALCLAGILFALIRK